jgi:hypothetical protein
MSREGEAIPTAHEARPLAFSWDARLRQHCWDGLEEKVRARLLENAGNIIAWWAFDEPEGRPSAIVFGERELCFATPHFADDRSVYLISGYLLDSASARRRHVEHMPGPAVERVRHSAAHGTRLVDIGLPDDARAVLGNLPLQVQDALQGPFAAGQRVEDCRWYYEGDERHLSVFIVFLAGSSTVTLATGTKVIPQGHTDATAHWQLVCHQATVIGRRGL